MQHEQLKFIEQAGLKKVTDFLPLEDDTH